jgi:hypothetical protein
MFPLLLATEPVVRLTSQARIIAAILAIAFMVLILELIRRHLLHERYSVIWFLAGIAMLAGAAFPDLLRLLAQALGVRDATIALFSLLFLVLLGLALNFSVIISRQADQITRLAQEQALETAREDGAGSNGSEGPREAEEERLQG